MQVVFDLIMSLCTCAGGILSNHVFVFLCRWYFALISLSGLFSVTFSVIFAYVADITEEHERSTAYGLVFTCSYFH